MLAIMLSPTLGAWISLLTGSWRWIFVILACVSACLRVAAGLRMEETLTPAGRLTPDAIVSTPAEDARKLITDRHQMALLLTLLVAFTCMFSEQSTDTFILQTWYSKGTFFYSTTIIAWTLIFILGLVFSAISNTVFGALRKVRWGLGSSPISAVFMIVVAMTPMRDYVLWFLAS